jgi:hypothetical protein
MMNAKMMNWNMIIEEIFRFKKNGWYCVVPLGFRIPSNWLAQSIYCFVVTSQPMLILEYYKFGNWKWRVGSTNRNP